MAATLAGMGQDMGLTRRSVLTGAGGVLLAGSVPMACANSGLAGAAQHPFLLVNADDDLDELRGRASAEPWATWEATARAKSAEPYDPAAAIGTRVRQLAQIAGATSLTYLLDPAGAETHTARILQLIDVFHAEYYPILDTTNWERTVGTSCVFFHLVIGLDLVYNELSASVRSAIEMDKLIPFANWYYANRADSRWTTARIGGYGIWAVYTQNQARITESINALRGQHELESTPGGGFVIAPGYASHRYGSGGDRDTKSYYIDVLTKTNANSLDYYTDRAMVGRIEFLTGYVSTPVTRRTTASDGTRRVARVVYTFGDTNHIGDATWRSARTYSAARFGQQAGRNAGWSLNRVTDNHVPGLITSYVLTEQAPLSNTTVPSRIFPRIGAWFLENSTSENALAGALWNASKAGQHQHKDTNALHLTAYGEHVLRNSGYNGFNNDAAGFAWSVIHNRAVVNNTVMLAYDAEFTDDFHPPATNDHRQKFGAGITEGLVGGLLDYAEGDSGNALPNGLHRRNFVFVHPQAGVQGYWLLFDEVRNAPPTLRASVALHPNSDADPQVVAAEQEYTYRIGGPFPRTSNDVRLTIFLAGPPRRVAFKPGPLASRAESFQGRYLYTSYSTDQDGRANLVTVLFPHDRTHPKAAMRRVTGTQCTGASVTHPSGAVDYALEGRNDTTAGLGAATFRAQSAVFRERGGGLDFYFVRRGVAFTHGGHGFEAALTIGIHLKGTTGGVLNRHSGAVEVILRHPGITGARLDGTPAQVVESGPGWILVRLPVGTFRLELVVA